MSTIPDVPLCGDFVSPTENAVDCPVGDCCGVMREVVQTKLDNGGTIDEEVGRHACESTLVSHFNQTYDLTCENAVSSGEACLEYTDGLSNGVIRAEKCLCNTERLEMTLH